MADCLFCKIVEKSIPADVVYEDGDVVAFRDIHPQAAVHLLVIPKQHVPDLAELSDGALAGQLLLVARKLGAEYDTEGHGFRVVSNSGSQAEIPHVHLHVLGGQATIGPLAGGE